MSDEPFGRQPLPVIVTVEGDKRDATFWANLLKARAEYKGDLVDWWAATEGSMSFKIYPRAVND